MKKLLSNKAYIAVFVAPGLILFLVMAVIPLFTTRILRTVQLRRNRRKSLYRIKKLQRTIYNRSLFPEICIELIYSGSRFFVYSDPYRVIPGHPSGKRDQGRGLLQNCIFPAGSNLQYGNRTALVQDLQQ